jgi:hypothetical protein
LAISSAFAASMPVERVDLDLGERLGLLDGELLDLHAALDRAQAQVGAVGAVQQHREVELRRSGAAGDHDALDDVALDVEAQDRLRGLVRLVGVFATFTPPALPRPPVLTCALTTTTPPSFSAAAFASSGVSAMMPGSTGTSYFSNRSRAWYS